MVRAATGRSDLSLVASRATNSSGQTIEISLKQYESNKSNKVIVRHVERFSTFSKFMIDERQINSNSSSPLVYCQNLKMTSRKPQADSRARPISGCTTSLILVLALIVAIANQQTRQVEASDVGPLWLVSKQVPHRVSSRLESILARVGPNMRASADYHDFKDIKLNESLEAWQVLHDQVRDYANKQALYHKSNLIQLLNEANVSQICLNSANETLDSIGQLQSWAVQMWSYSGNFPPVASFAGHFHDLGSYKGCIELARPRNSVDNEKIHSASYCTIGFRPILPARPRFHLIFKQVQPELVNQFNETDIMALMASQAQYFHYLYLKTGVCVPSECSPRDIQQVAKTIGRKLALTSAPVKCFTQSTLEHINGSKTQSSEDLYQLENSEPVLIDLNRKMNFAQTISVVVVGTFFAVVLVATVWHGIELALKELLTRRKFSSSNDLSDYEAEQQSGHVKHQLECDRNNNDKNHHQFITMDQVTTKTNRNSSNVVDISATQKLNLNYCFKNELFYYFSMFTNGMEFCDTSMRSNEIQCLHGFRVGTMLWIICVHVMQYNDWSGFTQIYENVPSLQNPFIHPIINANYVVDNFFLMSGLLAAYTTWHSNKGTSANFSIFQSLLARYLRLTPQVLLISLMYILLPLIGHGGPFWYDMTHYASKYCEKNWWVNLLHLQAFYREDEICNLVGWWISVDMFYYIVGIALLWMILNKHVRLACTCTSALVGFCTIMTIWRHYTWGLSPNNLGLVPQVNEVWTEFVVKFFWSPYPHAYVFFLGLWLGYLMANKIAIHQVRRWSKLGWSLSLASLTVINLSSRLWLVGALELSTDHQVLSTSYNVVCVIIWASSFGWMIVACHYGCASLLNKLLCTKASVMLSKASFIIYLSHMLVLRAFFGSQYNLIEVSMTMLVTMVVSITFLSVLFGVFLCVAFEAPCMKIQRLILNKIKSIRKLPPAGISYAQNNKTSDNDPEATTSYEEKITFGAAGVALFK